MSKRKTYTDEFKTMIAELVLSGQSVKEVSAEYSLSQTAIRNWVKKKTPIDVKGDTTRVFCFVAVSPSSSTNSYP